MKINVAAVMLVLLPPLLQGCSSTRPEQDLSKARAIILLRELGDLGVWFPDGSHGMPCPIAGGATDTLLLASHMTITPDSCELSAVGDTLVLEGDPDVVFELETWQYLDDIGLDMTALGTVAWRRNGDGEALTCKIDMAMRGAVATPSRATCGAPCAVAT